jgi:hypothetical protein
MGPKPDLDSLAEKNERSRKKPDRRRPWDGPDEETERRTGTVSRVSSWPQNTPSVGGRFCAGDSPPPQLHRPGFSLPPPLVSFGRSLPAPLSHPPSLTARLPSQLCALSGSIPLPGSNAGDCRRDTISLTGQFVRAVRKGILGQMGWKDILRNLPAVMGTYLCEQVDAVNPLLTQN